MLWNRSQLSFSRTRGGDPEQYDVAKRTVTFFPHTRVWSCGWKNCQTASLSFSRTRGCDPTQDISSAAIVTFFPHTRGWSRDLPLNDRLQPVFPAHAGVVLSLKQFQKHLGSFSRTRGGDPPDIEYKSKIGMFFPHTRVWSHLLTRSLPDWWVFPAHAGVILVNMEKQKRFTCFSRTRGCDPNHSGTQCCLC